MDILLVMLFSTLPMDIVHHILSYTGGLKYRNGKYMGQISTTDERYKLLLGIPRNVYTIPSIPTHYRFLYVNVLLSIKIHSESSQPLEYEYCFKKIRHIYCRYFYAPK